MLIRESIIERALLALYNEPRENIRNNILGPRLAFDLDVKLLKE